MLNIEERDRNYKPIIAAWALGLDPDGYRRIRLTPRSLGGDVPDEEPDNWWRDDPLSRDNIGKEWDDIKPKRGRRTGNGPTKPFDEPPPHPGEPAPKLPPEPDRGQLSLGAWLNRKIPPRDFLLGGVMCTTSRRFIFGETGVGKTLIAMDIGAAVAAGLTCLRWAGQRAARVMYIDGELPIETFKERMELLASRYPDDIEFYGYNRDALGDDGLPPLNTETGRDWVRREIDAIKPDVIIFDSIFCLLSGSAKEEETWAPMKPFVRELTRRKIAQVWLHHANDMGKSFSDKTREWEMDTVVFLSRPVGDDGEPDHTAIKLEFRKARLRTPANADQFEPFVVRPGVDWMVEDAPKGGLRRKGSGMTEDIRREYVNAYNRLCDGIRTSAGLDGHPVRKVRADDIRDELKSRGWLDVDEKGRIYGDRAEYASGGQGEAIE